MVKSTQRNPIPVSERPNLRFDHKDKPDFYVTLRKRVNAYFEENKLSKHYNTKMVTKTLFILTVFFTTYGLLLSNIFAAQDADIEQIPLIRLNPHQDLWWIHRFQHIYIFAIYSLTSIAWVFARDYAEYFHPKVNGKGKTDRPVWEFVRMVLFKLSYYTLFVATPFLVMDIPWQYFVIGFVIMHLVEGLTLALIFQLAHVIEGTNFPLPDENNKIHHSWAAHQLYTTANFGCKNDFLNYICGGLNFQVEHHLFPTICHVHYKQIPKTVYVDQLLK